MDSEDGPRTSIGAEVRTGFGSLRQGFSFVLSRPRHLVMGAIPPLITSVLLAAFLILVWVNAGAVAETMTPFADAWADDWRGLMRAALSLIFFAAAVLVSVLVFTSLTLAIGSPIYDTISESVEEAGGGVARRVDYPARVGIPRAIKQTLFTVLETLAVAVGVFLLGFVPVIGSALAPIVGGLIGAVLVTRELVGSTTERRGMVTLRERSRLLGRRRALTLGFGVPVYILVSIPFVAVAVFPAAVAGATILTRRMFGERLP